MVHISEHLHVFLIRCHFLRSGGRKETMCLRTTNDVGTTAVRPDALKPRIPPPLPLARRRRVPSSTPKILTPPMLSPLYWQPLRAIWTKVRWPVWHSPALVETWQYPWRLPHCRRCTSPRPLPPKVAAGFAEWFCQLLGFLILPIGSAELLGVLNAALLAEGTVVVRCAAATLSRAHHLLGCHMTVGQQLHAVLRKVHIWKGRRKLTEEYPSTPSMGTGDGGNSVVVHARHTTQRFIQDSFIQGVKLQGLLNDITRTGGLGPEKGPHCCTSSGWGGGVEPAGLTLFRAMFPFSHTPAPHPPNRHSRPASCCLSAVFCTTSTSSSSLTGPKGRPVFASNSSSPSSSKLISLPEPSPSFAPATDKNRRRHPHKSGDPFFIKAACH